MVFGQHRIDHAGDIELLAQASDQAEDKAKAENEVLRREAAALREQLAKERRRESRREERAEQAAAEQAAADEKQG